jgi:putative lipoprotein
MKTKLALAVFLALSTIFPALAACQGGEGSANGTTTITSGKQPNASVSGTVTYRERLGLTPGARLKNQLRDTSYQDAPAALIAEQIIENPGQVPIEFKLEYNRGDVANRNTYSLQADIIESGGRLAFTNDTAYDVITRGNPRKVNMLLVMAQPPPLKGSDGEAVDPSEWVEAEYPIVGGEMLPPQEGDFLRVFYLQSELGNCSRRRDQSVEVEGNDIVVSLTHFVPPSMPWAVPCNEEMVELDEIIDLNGKLTAGENYQVIVNGTVTNTFSRPAPDFPLSVIDLVDVLEAELKFAETAPSQRILAVTYGIPTGSGCSQENGYTIQRREPDVIKVLLTYHRVAPGEPIACIADYPTREVTIPLGSGFEAGREYAVKVNREEIGSFTGGE